MIWLWIGGAVVVLGSLLAAFPGKRRDPTEPVSAPVTDGRPAAVPPTAERETEPEPATVG